MKGNTCFSSSYLSQSGLVTVKILKSKYRPLLGDKHLWLYESGYYHVGYTPNYRLAE
jgi:hypothetical protein